MTRQCVYCLGNGELTQEQVLERGEHVYLCAPRGQLVEGFLAIAPYECLGSYASAPHSYGEEVVLLGERIAAFYERAYGSSAIMVYEQGRAGGGAVLDPDGRFPLHAHLCFLPLDVDLGPLLAPRFAPTSVPGMSDLGRVARGSPYLYTECVGDKTVYLARRPQDRAALESFRLKPMIAELIGRPERGNWRHAPGDHELDSLIERWRMPCPT